MAYVVPNTSAKLFYNTGLTPRYDNSLYFSSESAKNNYFDSLGGFNITDMSYQRENVNRIRIYAAMRNVYNCDYMRFRNDSFENKWFYAFVLQINYINNTTAEIVYQLDPLMTWMGDFSMKQCFIVRQHTTRDGIGNNICDEGLPTGPYVTEGYHQLWGYAASNATIRLAMTKDTGDLKKMSNIYAGLEVLDSDVSTISTTIKSLVANNNVDSIVGLCMVPNDVAGKSDYVEKDVSYNKPYSDFGGYTPRNKKLFCYPYKYCKIENSEGSSMELKYEYFNDVPDATSTGNTNFRVVIGNYATGVEAFITPKDYNDHSGYEDRLTMTHAPLCPVGIDSYDAYLAQRNAYYAQDLEKIEADRGRAVSVGATQGLVSSGTSAINSAINGLNLSGMDYSVPRGGFLDDPARATVGSTGAGAKGLLSALVSGLSGAAGAEVSNASDAWARTNDYMVENTTRPTTSNTLHGQQSTDVLFSYGLKGFYIYQKCITKNYAMMLDAYFDLYGYYIKQYGTPNMNARPHWTYVKTQDCVVSGSMPASDRKIIEAIFDNGIRP